MLIYKDTLCLPLTSAIIIVCCSYWQDSSKSPETVLSEEENTPTCPRATAFSASSSTYHKYVDLLSSDDSLDERDMLNTEDAEGPNTDEPDR